MQDNGVLTDDGIERAKAEYLILALLAEEGGELEYEELQRELATVSNGLAETTESPLHFSPTCGPLDYQSRSFVRALSRCANAKCIEQNGSGMKLTDFGSEFLSESESYFVPDEFVTTVEALLADRTRMRVSG